MGFAIQISLALVGGYDVREHGLFTFNTSLFNGEDVLA